MIQTELRHTGTYEGCSSDCVTAQWPAPTFFRVCSNLWSKDEDDGDRGAELGSQKTQKVFRVRPDVGKKNQAGRVELGKLNFISQPCIGRHRDRVLDNRFVPWGPRREHLTLG